MCATGLVIKMQSHRAQFLISRPLGRGLFDELIGNSPVVIKGIVYVIFSKMERKSGKSHVAVMS